MAKTKRKTATSTKAAKKQTVSKASKEKKQPKVEEKKEKDIIAEKDKQILELEDKYARLFAEFDNFRRRTIKEKTELIYSASEKIIIELLPILDDFERALKVPEETKGDKEGMELIFNKFKKSLEKEGLKEIEAQDKELDTDFHEAITQIPAPSKKQKGKVIDVIEKGYFLNDKVIRFAKVVIGQ